MPTTRLYLRIWVPAAAAALFLTLPWASAQARDCERYPAVCNPPAETQATTDPAPRAAPAPKTKASTAKQADKPRAPASASREAPREQPSQAPTTQKQAQKQQPQTTQTSPAQPAPPTPPSRIATQLTTTIDAAVLESRPLTETDDEAFAQVGDQVAGQAGEQAAMAPAAEPVDAGQTIGTDRLGVKFVSADDANEIDLAAAEPDAGDWSWLRYLLAALGAVTAAASTVRYFMI